MKLVEIIPGIATSDACLKTTLALASAMGKTTAMSSDTPGFIANRLLMPYINEAIFALQEVFQAHASIRSLTYNVQNIGSREAIDTTMKLGTNAPMGPLELADFIGLDTCLAIMRCAAFPLS
jgi:3-hydroxybutyryl-CoA dehydrogenase